MSIPMAGAWHDHGVARCARRRTTLAAVRIACALFLALTCLTPVALASMRLHASPQHPQVGAHRAFAPLKVRRKRLSELETANAGRGFRLRHALEACLGLMVGGLALRNLIERRRDHEPKGSSHASHSTVSTHAPRAVVLEPDGVDPAAKDGFTGVNHPPLEVRVVDSLAVPPSSVGQALSGSAAAPPHVSSGPRAVKLTPADGSVPAAHASWPSPFDEHLPPQEHETLIWSGLYRIPGITSGRVALTNQRFLCLYERRTLKLWPPKVESQERRQQMPLTSILEVTLAHERRLGYLAAAALLFLWFPFGTFAACLAVGLYFALPRPVLVLRTSEAKRHYPLSLDDQQHLQKAIEHQKTLPNPSAIGAKRLRQQAS